ncbi:MAG TPA: UDP-N-acetylmuramoyl-tripeptide--D-alanyl-D-alanine ligase [Bacteroidales bacterium]|jgi:UDP-N-acetylmuramoyl-tripeptide--D-alanyl-D-alanine ligase|nr:UDP-N-acetylmuramoyl-tripeptide--D-alanyl-D-alanine ligase [Bacteroidales bacterium]
MESTTEFIYQKYINCSGVCTDTRNIIPNTIFFCLKGENFDGNNFVNEALEKGAKYVVTENTNFKKHPQCICVDDSLKSLQDLSLYHRRKCSIPIIGITGTNGKTTTKELLVAVLSKKYRVAYTKGNFNNHIGVPLTLLSIQKEDEIAVVEMGANHPGEIAQLCKLVLPDFGVITNIGKAHIEGFKTFENIINTKKALYQAVINRGGTLFVNKNDDLLISLINGYKSIIYYNPELLLVDTCEVELLHLSFLLNKREVRTHLTGKYNLNNILAAMVIGDFFNVTTDDIIQAIEEYTPTNSRSQIVKEGNNTIIADFYNANPSSMKAALLNLHEHNHPSKLAILGEMRELGNSSFEEHQKIIELCNELNIKTLFIGEAFCEHNPPLCFATVSDLNAYLQRTPIQNSLILLKGSRSIHLENVRIA